MHCPNCGDVRARYEVSRKEFWSKKKRVGREVLAPKPRTDFKAVCSKCGHKWKEPNESLENQTISDNQKINESDISEENV